MKRTPMRSKTAKLFAQVKEIKAAQKIQMDRDGGRDQLPIGLLVAIERDMGNPITGMPTPSNPGELKLVRKPIARMSERMDGPDRACVAVPKGVKAKPGKRTPNRAEADWMDRIVRFGCVACWIDGRSGVPPAVHHILRGGHRIGHLYTLPLCDPGHHQGGQPLGVVSRHPWKTRFEAQYGSELDLLDRLRAEIGETA